MNVPFNFARMNAGHRFLHLMADAIAKTPSGQRNRELNPAAFRLGRFAARGWLTETEIEVALAEACRANGYTREHGLGDVRGTVRSGLRAGLRNPAVAPTNLGKCWQRAPKTRLRTIEEEEQAKHTRALRLWQPRRPIEGTSGECYLCEARSHQGEFPATLAYLPPYDALRQADTLASALRRCTLEVRLKPETDHG